MKLKYEKPILKKANKMDIVYWWIVFDLEGSEKKTEALAGGQKK